MCIKPILIRDLYHIILNFMRRNSASDARRIYLRGAL